MALITCPEVECSKRVSETALACPFCGYDFATERNNRIALREANERQNRKWQQDNWGKAGKCTNCGGSFKRVLSPGSIPGYFSSTTNTEAVSYETRCVKCGTRKWGSS